jgi:hypothetical protein
MKRRTLGLILLAAAGVVASLAAGTAYVLSLPQFGGELAGDEPIRRTVAAARAGSVELVTPRIGEIVDADRDLASSG